MYLLFINESKKSRLITYLIKLKNKVLAGKSRAVYSFKKFLLFTRYLTV